MTSAQSCLEAIVRLLTRYGIEPVALADGMAIPGSYWGDSEAGLIGGQLYFRPDTPLHSVLHEACHFVCMSEARRGRLERDAGGDYDEENAVCYLQIVLADEIAEAGRMRMCSDMDAWGYTFRLGSAQNWFEQDADDARQWLMRHRVIDAAGRLTWCKRQ